MNNLKYKSPYEEIKNLAEGEIEYLYENDCTDVQKPDVNGETIEDKSWYFFENQMYIMRLAEKITSDEEKHILSLFDNIQEPLDDSYRRVVEYCTLKLSTEETNETY